MTRWLSKPALLWVFDEAPDVPARLVSTLLAVARYADTDGRGAYPSAATVAVMTRKSESQARRDIAALARLGLLTPGDRRLVKDIRADKRPNVYDLPMPRGASGRTPWHTPRGASGDGTGCIPAQNGVRPDAPEEVLKTSGRRLGDRAGARSPSASRHPGFRAPPCPGCGKPYSQDELANPSFRASALAGELLHDACIQAADLRYLKTASADQIFENGECAEAVAAGRDPAEFTALGYAP